MSNITSPTQSYSTREVDLALLPVYIIVVLFGTLGNAVVIHVIRVTRAMHSTTNYLLVNLAIGDMLTLLWCIPYKVLVFYFDHPTGTAGDYICKFFTSYNVTVITLTVSIFTLTLLSVERYRVLLNPMHHKFRLDQENVWYAIAAIWISAIAFMVPLFVVTGYNELAKSCRVEWGNKKQEDLYSLCIMVFSIFVPLMVTVVCYVRIIKGLYFNNTIAAGPAGYTQESDLREKRKIVKMLLIVTSAFVLCFLPYATFRIVVASADPNDHKRYNHVQSLREIFKFLCYSSSSFNPVIYCFQSSNYRAACRKLFKKAFRIKETSEFDNSADLRTMPSQFSVGDNGASNDQEKEVK
ncbi:prolactin-releasing peptide receptor isoform X2 [Nematostella vectensis]|nr:prolactin-releasing peptide receptor isoform X2 [Nematostella vectensis]XP_032219000.2 prolactin-releasing peptide receptor isoform X2 [Nematostella vectensis]